MKLDKAIERLQDSLDHNTILITRGDKDAIKLGIEALNKWKEYRASAYSWWGNLLPSETK